MGSAGRLERILNLVAVSEGKKYEIASPLGRGLVLASPYARESAPVRRELTTPQHLQHTFPDALRSGASLGQSTVRTSTRCR